MELDLDPSCQELSHRYELSPGSLWQARGGSSASPSAGGCGWRLEGWLHGQRGVYPDPSAS